MGIKEAIKPYPTIKTIGLVGGFDWLLPKNELHAAIESVSC